MGWVCEMTEEEAEEERQRIEEINAACEDALDEPEPELDPHREGIDWIRGEDGRPVHPLQHRCSQSATRIWRQLREHGFENYTDSDLTEFMTEFRITGAKLAGALNPLARGAPVCDASLTVALLKRALDHLHKSQAGLEALALRKLLSGTLLAQARNELFEIREGILGLVDEIRGRT